MMDGRKCLRAILGGLLILSLVTLSGCGLQAENDKLKKESADLKQQVASLTTESENLKKEVQDLRSDNESLKKGNDGLKSKLATPKKESPKKKKG